MLLAWLPIAILLAVITSIILGFFYPMALTVADLTAGFDAVFHAWSGIKDYSDSAFHGVPTYLQELRSPSPNSPWDIKFLEIFIGLGMAVLGTLFTGPLIIILAALKVLPYILRGEWTLFAYYFDSCGPWALICFPTWLFLVAVWPVLVLLQFG